MYEISFAVPDKQWSTNQDRNLNPYARAERILTWKTTTHLAWASYCNRERIKRRVGNSLVQVEIPFRQNRRRDPHNYCGTVVKAIIDGLVLAGAWPDDTAEYVEHISPTLRVDAGPVVVRLFPRVPAHFACEHGEFDVCGVSDCGGGWVINI